MKSGNPVFRPEPATSQQQRLFAQLSPGTLSPCDEFDRNSANSGSRKDESCLIQQHLQFGGEEEDCFAHPKYRVCGPFKPSRAKLV